MLHKLITTVLILGTSVGCTSGVKTGGNAEQDVTVSTTAPDAQSPPTEDEVAEQEHPVSNAATACRSVIEEAAKKYSVDKNRFYPNTDGALMFAVAPSLPEQVDYLDCIFDELGTTQVIRTNVWNSTVDLGRQSEEQDGVEYQYSVRTNQYGGNELQIAIQELG